MGLCARDARHNLRYSAPNPQLSVGREPENRGLVDQAILDQAMRLPEDEHLELADTLRQSVDHTDPELTPGVRAILERVEREAELRISEDRTGEEAGVDRQRADCFALCTRLGLEIRDADVFMDNDVSAYLDKKRPGFEQLLERVKQGPSQLVVWHVDRLYRRPREPDE